jgi:ubiquinone/menaquinone biosynthesis C-methylase UbiE
MKPGEPSPFLEPFSLEMYDRYAVPVYFEPYAIELASRIDAANLKSVLEIACGTGALTRHLGEKLPPGALTASDLDQRMVDFARNKLRDKKINWLVADASKLPFDDNTFDLIVCQFGYMFVPDKHIAFSEAHRVLCNGGSLLFATWDKVEHNGPAKCIHRLFAEMFGELPAESFIPSSLNDHAEIRWMLESAGFRDISVETISKQAVAQSAMDVALNAGKSGPTGREIMKRNPGAVQHYTDALFAELKKHFGNQPMIAPMRAIVSQGWKR